MGLIRKSLMIGTAGVVRGSSKKQRVAKAQLKELRQQTQIARMQAAAAAAAPPQPAPAAGWYPSPTSPGYMQWWDGVRWTSSFAPEV